jgi:hypothetical protein
MNLMGEQTTPGSTGAKTGPHEIHEHESHRRYKLVYLNNEAIERTAAELVEGSKLLNNRDLWFENFAVTIDNVRRWCDEAKDLVRLVLVDIRSSKVLFYFIPMSDRYDLALGDRMTELEVKLGGSAGIGHVETLQVPERSIERFVGDRALVVWPAGQGALTADAGPTGG